MATYAATDTGFAVLVKQLVETVVPGPLTSTQERIRHLLPLAIVVLFVVRGIAEFASTYCLGWVGRQVVKTLRARVFSKFLALPSTFYDSASAGELLSRLTYNVEQVAEATSNIVTVLVREALTAIGLAAYLVYLSPPLAAFVFITVPIIAVLTRLLGRMFRRYSQRIQQSMGDLTRVAQEALANQRVVKIFNAQEYENGRFDVANEGNRRMNMRLTVTKAGGDGVTALLAAVALAGVALFATSDSVRQHMNIGDFSGFVTALVLMMRPLRQLSGVNAVLQRGVSAAESIFELLDQPEERDTGVLAPARIDGAVEFRDVGFGYSEAKGQVLREISLTARRGETIAIVGRSGSGKSTLVSLIPRFYEPTRGTVLVDGRPVTDYSLAVLRSHISLVSQEVVLFNDTIARNIAYGGLHATPRAPIEDAARAAHLDEFITRLPEGLDTVVGDRGLLLSGGQRQRIAIARALLKNAPILILDEATSALDTESERHIQEALAALMSNRTTFVIAHRLSTVERADRIIVMQDGRIVESGTHAELLAANSHYAGLYRLQFRDE
jgi:subfamily B ATP-binding cassette protein MsbA